MSIKTKFRFFYFSYYFYCNWIFCYRYKYIINALGIPLILFIIDKLLCGKLFGCKMSICECLANYICCCFCIKKTKIDGDEEVFYNSLNNKNSFQQK